MKKTPVTTKFAADSMLGSLARKLRVLGFDTVYLRDWDDRGLEETARSEGRIILTCDRALSARAKGEGLPVFLVTGRSDGRRVASILDCAEEAGIRLSRGSPLCSVCGGRLDMVSRKDAARLLPAGIASRHRLFFRCEHCGKLYWRGGHWKKLRRLLAAVSKRVDGPR